MDLFRKKMACPSIRGNLPLRRLMLAVVALCLLVLGGAYRATADNLPVGLLSFDPLSVDPATGNTLYSLDVTNLTQPGGGSTVTTFLDFSSFTLTVDLSNGNSGIYALSAADPFGDLQTGAIFMAGDVISATLGGVFSPTVVTLADGSTVNIAAGSVTTLSDPNGALMAGDTVAINATTQPLVAPEPETLMFLICGLLPVCLPLMHKKRLRFLQP